MFRYNAIYNTLKEDITAGVYAYNTLIPSENRLCQTFGVERATVRKALELLVSDGLIEKCPGIGSKVIFRTQQDKDQAGLPAGNSLIGFFIANGKEGEKKITEPYYADLFYFFERECQARNCQLIYITIDKDTDIQSILNKYNFLAAIFVTKMEESVINRAKQTGTPIILVNEKIEGMVSISCDHAMGAGLALEHLLGKGHERIAILSGPKGFLASDAKLSACYTAIHRYGVEIRPEWLGQGDWTFNSGYSEALRIFPERAEYDPKTCPTAIYVFNDMMALGVLKALRTRGYSIPEDISVVGHDNMAQLKYTEPDLTTIDGSTAYLARIVVDSAYKNAFSKFDRGCTLTVPVKLVERKTVRDISKRHRASPKSNSA